MSNVELRSKTELTSIAGTENVYVQEAGNPYTVKRILFNTIKTWIDSSSHPVGSFYVQYPDATSNVDATAFPTSVRPATMFGGTWVEQFNTENVFFRTAGTDYQTRTNGLSADQVQGHEHSVGGNATGGGGTTYFGDVNLSGSSALTATRPTVMVDDGTNGTPRKGSVTEPRNRLVKIWKRTVL